jgi:hypothetical protein
VKRWAYIGIVIAVLPLLAFGPGERTALTHWALLIGVSDYIHFDDVEGGDLPGAEHDALGVRDYLLSQKDFPRENVRVLLNHDATKAAIEDGITGWLRERVRPGDNVVIFFAGHGSQMWDESGDEDDGLDETIAPADVMATSTDADISDDEFNDWLGTLPSDNVIVVLDNCNSGTGTRDVTPYSRARLLARDINEIERPAGVTRRALPGQEDESGFDAGETRVLELAAAQPFQIAVDAFFPGQDGSEAFHGGAFTTFLLQELWRAPGDATYEEVFEAAYEALKRNRFQQDPYISADVSLKDLPLFFIEGGTPGPSEMSLPVTSTTGSTAQLGAGLALGITAGSVFETDGGARLVVESVTPRTTLTRITAGAVSVGERVRLTAHRYARSPLRVDVAGIDSRLASALRAALADAAGVVLVEEESSFSHLIVRRGGDELRVVGADGFIRHEGIPATESGMGDLSATLRKEAAAKSLGDMDNPAQSFGFELEISGGSTSFGVGEEITFTVQSDRDGYITLVDLGTDGTVALLAPSRELVTMPIRAGQRLTFPEATSRTFFAAQEPAGTGIVRAFLTPEPLAFRIPAGAEYRAGGEEFAAEITGTLIDAVGSDGDAVRLDSWATASIVYEVHN